MKTPVRLVNSIKKMLSFANMKMEVDGEKVWINRGQIQGSMLSPDLFNIYINDLIEQLEEAGLDPLAYADDLAAVCDGEENLYKAMDIIEKWAGQNDIEVNKKKSGILVIQNQRSTVDNYRGYPVKNWYKYLGVRLDYNLSPMTHLIKTKEMLEVYTRRNEWLVKEYFSPKSLMQLCEYFQFSRLGYGMCTFLEDAKVMEKLEVTRMMFLRSMLKFADNVSSNRFRMTINVPKMEYDLFVRLKKVLDKYKRHFGDEPIIHKGIMKAYFDELAEYLGKSAEDMDYKQLKETAKRWSVVKLGRKEGITVGDNFFTVTMRSLFKYIDRRDFCLIRFMVKSGFLSERDPLQCEVCGVELNRKHLTNVCPYMEVERDKIKEVLGVGPEEDLEERILEAYFNMRDKDVKRASEIIAAIKSFVMQIYVKRGEQRERLEREKEGKEEDESDNAAGAKARQKRLKDSTAEEEEDTDTEDESDSTAERKNAGGSTGSGRETAVAAKKKPGRKNVKTDAKAKEKAPKATTKQKEIVPKKRRKKSVLAE